MKHIKWLGFNSGESDITIITLELTDQNTKFIINNLYPLYLHDLSEIWGWKPNKYGVFEEDETLTLYEQNKVFDIWWSDPAVFFPYLIRVNGIPAGFALVATTPYTPPGCDFYLNEFFILRSFRGKKVAEPAAVEVFNNHPGCWEVQTNPNEGNQRAQSFWRKTLQKYMRGSYVEATADTQNDGNKIIFRFNNSST
ncbi:GNAT family N-acetyltransferase [Paenibacillus arenosi]|uniref:GNAT family N-acetyltransferase n=1 Tax=Paenibacillus arenosi TaxID=2774142 RepID=A0ABR9AYP2_9BACL|nr:GNAT family N-acetyltransferase [Paenibacillus arenosi]MBD8499261.1 GNAT family N-acetyltransferase [Paenibacillus arenosi]